MKAPDKIYFPEDGLPSYIDWDGSPIRTKQVAVSDICYIRKDVLLEWANSWLTFKRSGVVLDDGFSYAMEELIKKLNEM